MNYEDVMTYVEQFTKTRRDKFKIDTREYIRIFAFAKNINDECILDRFYDGDPIDPNGDKVKQFVQDKLHLSCKTVEKDGRLIRKYKITGIQERFTSATVNPPSKEIREIIKTNRCDILDTSANCEDDHRYSYHLYENIAFCRNYENYRRLHKVAQSIDRERRKRMKKSSIKYDNRKMGCYFHTVWGTSKYDENEATIDHPSLGIWWENPKQINMIDKKLYLQYQKYLQNHSQEQIVKLVNDLTMLDLRIENIEEVVEYILSNKL